MANCHKCWWADFNPDAPGRHTTHEEPDYLQMQTAWASPPMVRIVQSCAKNKHFFETFGMRDHDCPAFADYAAEEAKDEAANKVKAKTWKGRTSREKLPVSNNLLVLIPPMYEGDDDGYMVLLDAMAQGQDIVSELVLNLDDMNIRGKQLRTAYDFAGSTVKLAEFAKARDIELVRYVNKWCKIESERACRRGARLYGHVKRKKVVEEAPRKIAVLKETGGKRFVRGIKAPPRRKR